jgi:hypothetical protein
MKTFWKRNFAVLATGCCMLSIVGLGGTDTCQAVTGNILTGVGNGVIAAGVNALFAPLGANAQQNVGVPVANGLENAYGRIIDVQFPTVVVERNLFVP